MSTLTLSPAMQMTTVPAHEVQRGDIIALSGEWLTVDRNDDSTEGEVSTRSMVLTGAGDCVRTWSILALESVAILRSAEPVGAPVQNVVQLAALLPVAVVARIGRELLTECPTAAALRVLATVRDPGWQRFVDGVRIDWSGMFGWSRGNRAVGDSVRVRVQAAAALAGYPDAGLDLRSCAARLDEGNWLALLDAMRILREGIAR